MSEPTSKNCGQGLREHLQAIIMVLVQNGVSGPCEDIYRSMVEIAEFLRTEGGHDVYVPVGLVQELVVEAQATIHREIEEKHKGGMILSPGSGRTDN
jgi:hypothetical protein